MGNKIKGNWSGRLLPGKKSRRKMEDPAREIKLGIVQAEGLWCWVDKDKAIISSIAFLTLALLYVLIIHHFCHLRKLKVF